MRMLNRITAVVLTMALLLSGCTFRGSGQAATGSTTEPTTATQGNLEVQLLGDPLVVLEYGIEEYEDAGLLVTYNGREVEADVTVTLPEFGMPGDYTVAYRTDYQGITVTIRRMVRIVDTQPPVLTLTGETGVTVEMGEPYQEEGFLAKDNCDGDLTDRVLRHQVGNSIFYTVADSSGNVAVAQRDLAYVDTQPPVLTLVGGDTVTIMAGDPFVDPGYTAMDAAEGDLTASVTVTGTYDTFQPGTYPFTYTVQDSKGHVTQVTRNLIVQAHVQPETVYPEGKVIYLTYDDGPGQYTGKLLEVLAKYNVKATFFVVGSGDLSYLDEIVAGGHAIAIHSDTHNYGTIYSSETAFFNDFYAVQNKILEYTGVKTTLCRFPGGSSNRVSKQHCKGIMTRLTHLVEERGFQYFDWNVDSNDAGGAKTADEVFNNVINGVMKQDHSVVLQHDVRGFSVDAVERIIQWGLANGYTFLALDPTSPKAHHPVRN